ncbi:hypothetical protein [Shewanella acanthi]|uniref:hypothetical protein n=1 Tax=Shewanella acanthi TaxID=2864212 RepID=UPI001C662273|nr:hypothetical protein [Shewanella acanthi]QYJ80482.1 hypothetical protein K0H61_09020 [Shewanella acanthi]
MHLPFNALRSNMQFLHNTSGQLLTVKAVTAANIFFEDTENSTALSMTLHEFNDALMRETVIQFQHTTTVILNESQTREMKRRLFFINTHNKLLEIGEISEMDCQKNAMPLLDNISKTISRNLLMTFPHCQHSRDGKKCGSKAAR